MERSCEPQSSCAALRDAFERRTDSVRRLAAEFGLSATTVRRLAERGGWRRPPGAPAAGRVAEGPPQITQAWRTRLHARLRRLLEHYVTKLETWLGSPGDLSEQSPAEAERYAKTIIALVRCYSDLEEVLGLSAGARATRTLPTVNDIGEKEDDTDFDNLLTTLERRLDQLAAAGPPPGAS